MSNTKRQHYVWRKYLEAWAVNDKIWCNRNGNIFNSGLMGVAQQRYFYRIEYLEDNELEFLTYIANEIKGPLSENGIDAILNMLESLRNLVANYREFGANSEEVNNLELAKNNIIESLYSRMENQCKPYLNALYSQNMDYFKSEANYVDLLRYVVFQYCRTKKIKHNFSTGFKFTRSKFKVDMNKLSIPITMIVSQKIPEGMLADGGYGLQFLLNETNRNFITGDQPVVNIHAIGKDVDDDIENWELYYPISTKYALLISKNWQRFIDEVKIGPNVVTKYNKLIAEASHEQIFGLNENDVNVI